MAHWTLADIAWETFDAARVDQDVVRVVKAASLVERNARDYATYLANVFPDDADFAASAWQWAEEEVQHGEALARWVAHADPSWDFVAAQKRFTDGFRVPLDVTQSVRGSRSGELVARCVVEVGTSTYYTALGQSQDEPVLKEICRRIAADEFRHYKLFYDNMNRYLDRERVGKLRRAMVAFGRLREAEDDELSYAYYAANGPFDRPYDRRTSNDAHARRTLWRLRPEHAQRGIGMMFKAAGLDPQGRLARAAAVFMHGFVQRKARALEAAGA